MEQTDNKDQEGFSKEKSWINEKFSKIKDLTFKIVHYILKFDTAPVAMVCIISIIELMQLLAFSFDIIFTDAWEVTGYEEIFTVLSDFFNIFKIVNYITDKSFTLYLVIFYFVFVMLLVIIVDFIYLSLNLKSSIEKNYIAVEIFKVYALFFNTCFIIPFYELMFINFNCDALKVMKTTCFSGTNIIHVVFSGIGIVLTLIISLVFAGFYFEVKTITENSKNRWTPGYELTQSISKLIIVVLFRFCKNILDTDNVILSFILVLTSGIAFFKIAYEKPFHNLLVQKIHYLTSLVYFCTNILLFISKILILFGYNELDGNIEIWLVGFVLYTLYEFFYKNDFTNLLMSHTNNIIDADDIQQKIKFFLELIDKKDTNKSYGILLKGYVFHHEEVCEKKECPLKIVKKALIDENDLENKEINKTSLLLSHCNQLYEIALQKFPLDTDLRFSYTIFLLERLKNVNLAKLQLSIIESQNPSLSQNFTLFRFNIIVNEEIYNIEDESLNLDIAATLEFDRLIKKFKEDIENTGINYIEFWNSFIQDEINISKIKSLGFKINDMIIGILDTWNSIQALNSNDKTTLKLYGMFLIDILNEKAYGQTFIDKSLEAINNYNNVKYFKHDVFSVSTDGTPCILASPTEKGAIISQLTSSVLKFFGYSSKLELVGKNVNFLLPQIFHEYHTLNINTYMKNKIGSKLSKSKRTQGIGYSKTGFVFKATMNINFLPSLTSNPSLAVMIKREKVLNYTGYFITNADLDILYLSSETINMFNINDKGLWSIRNYNNLSKTDRINLKQLIEELKEVDKEDLSSVIEKYKNPEDIHEVRYLQMDCQDEEEEDKSALFINQRNIGDNYSLYKGKNSLPGTLFIKEARFGAITSDYLIIKVEILINLKKEVPNVSLSTHSSLIYDQERSEIRVKNKYRELIHQQQVNNQLEASQVTNVKKSKKNAAEKDKDMDDLGDDLDLYESKESKARGIKNYGKDVKLFKWDYRACTITKIHIDESRKLGEMIYGADSGESYHNEEDDDDEENETANTKIDLKKYEIFNKKNTIKTDTVATLRLTSFIILLFHIALAITYFILSNLYINLCGDYIKGVSYISQQLNYSVSSSDLLMTLLIKNSTGYKRTTSTVGDISSLSKILQDNALFLYNLDTSINSLALFYNQNLSDVLDSTVQFNYIESQNTGVPIYNNLTFNFMESNLEMMSSLFSISIGYNTKYDITDRNIYYYIYNSMNSFYLKSIEYIDGYINLFANTSIFWTGLIIIIVTSVVFLILIYVLNRVLIHSLSYMNDILMEFVSIKPIDALNISKSTETFVKNIKINNLDEEEDFVEEEVDLKDIKRNTAYIQQKLEQSREGYNFIIFIMILVMICFELFFVVQFVLLKGHEANLKNYMVVYNTTYINTISQRMLSTGTKIKIFNNKFTVKGLPVKDSLFNIYKDVITLKQDMQVDLLVNNFYSSAFIDKYNNEIFVAPLNGSALLRANLDLSEYPLDSPTFGIVYANFYDDLEDLNGDIDNGVPFSEIVNNNLLKESDMIQNKILNPFMNILIQAAFDDIMSQNQFMNNFIIIWFVLYTSVVIIFYLAVWRPTESKLEFDYGKTKMMLLLIPNRIIMKKPNIINILNKENLTTQKRTA